MGDSPANPLRQRRPPARGQVLAWALYDWGNSAFATSVMVGFYPLFFNTYWSVEATGAETTARLMTVNGVASLSLALSAPLLGAIADRGGWRKLFLAVFAVLGAAATASLSGVPHGAWLLSAVAFGIASFGFAAANVFYNAMLVQIADPNDFDRVSGYGYALGYLGGGVLLAFHMAMLQWPGWFGLAGTEAAVRMVFLTVALWWLIFTLPLLMAVRERRPSERQPLARVVRQGLGQLLGTFHRIRRFRPAVIFLAAYWLYIDGVNTMIKVAIDFGYKLGIGQRDLILALLIVQMISFPAALFFGWLGGRLGAKAGLLIGLGVYVGVTSWAAFMSTLWEFYLLACAIGLVQGGVASLSRSYYARLIPSDESAEFFGFYNMIGKFAAVLGPLLVAAAATVTQSARSAVAAILPLLLLGALLLILCPQPESEST